MMTINNITPSRNLFENIEKLNITAVPGISKKDVKISVDYSSLGNRMHEELLASEDKLESKYRELIKKLSSRDDSADHRMRLKERLTFVRRLKKRVRKLMDIVFTTNKINKLHFDKLMIDIDICIKN
ncbi:hypothetical protein [Paenibacillus sp. O199]|uniref:hypothetical protein n=1 Tax=Paenibacillus sp. O199 TaxID=1643925 RepID=UPI0007BF583B|nr:hypothetical protein [Paenibacillus sp. O199]